MHHPANEPLHKAGYDVIVKFTQDQKQILKMEAHFQGEKFAPQQIKTHAALEALHATWPDIVQKVNGLFTDADRFNGLMQFSLLGSSQDEDEKLRFTFINEQLQKYEEQRGFTKGGRCKQDFIDIANFILHQLAETSTMKAPTAKPE